MHNEQMQKSWLKKREKKLRFYVYIFPIVKGMAWSASSVRHHTIEMTASAIIIINYVIIINMTAKCSYWMHGDWRVARRNQFIYKLCQWPATSQKDRPRVLAILSCSTGFLQTEM